MTEIPINEIFETLQGEGSHTGTPSLFIRTQGCDVGCPWCDTYHTWKFNLANMRDPELIMQKQAASEEFAFFSVERLITVAAAAQARHVVITGGEPCRLDLIKLTTELIRKGHTVQIETSGTQQVLVHPGVFVTVSPKLNMPGNHMVREDALERANEIKMPVGKLADVCALRRLLKTISNNPRRLVYLQPISGSKKATEICREAAMKHNFRVSIQVHNLLGWR